MANYTYTQNGITFNDIKEPSFAQGGITVGTKYSTNAFTGELNSISVDATNAISIDWNGAKVKGFANLADYTTTDVTIYSTGSLLKYIEKAYYQAYTGNKNTSVSYANISLNGLSIQDENRENKPLESFNDLVNYTEKALQQAYFSENISYNFNFLFAPRVSAGSTQSYTLLDTANDTQLITGSTFMDKSPIAISEHTREYVDEQFQNQWVNVLTIDMVDIENESKTYIGVVNQVFDLRIIDLNEPLLSSEYFATSVIHSFSKEISGSMVNGESIKDNITYVQEFNDSELLNKFDVRSGVGLLEHNVQDIFIGTIGNDFASSNYPGTFKTLNDLGTKTLATSISYYTPKKTTTYLYKIGKPSNEIKNVEVSLTANGVIKIYKGNRYVNKIDSQTPIHSIPFSITVTGNHGISNDSTPEPTQPTSAPAQAATIPPTKI